MAFRNGVMRHRVLGLEAVLADGTIYSDVTRVVKNSAGYELKHLFIGAEGTLGIVTSIALKLDLVARAHATALFGLPSVAALLDTVAAALDPEAGSLCAAEAHGFTAHALDMTHPIFLLLSLGGSKEPALHAAFEHLFQQLLSAYPGASGIVATSVRQQQELWRLREDTDAIYRDFPNAPSFDVSVPMSEIQVYVARIVSGFSGIDPGLKPFIFGHVADGNLHIVLNRRGPLPVALSIAVEALLYKGLTNNGGSISAEHGIGKTRIESLSVTAHLTKLATMPTIKSLLDPSIFLTEARFFVEIRNNGSHLDLINQSRCNTTSAGALKLIPSICFNIIADAKAPWEPVLASHLAELSEQARKIPHLATGRRPTFLFVDCPPA
jgi:FAD/FMN-containing dehydrogenase